jgi:hypothetical protein
LNVVSGVQTWRHLIGFLAAQAKGYNKSSFSLWLFLKQLPTLACLLACLLAGWKLEIAFSQVGP